MTRKNYKKIIYPFILAITLTLIIFPTLGKVSLWEIDEGRYLICAQNAIDKGKWIIPEYNGGPRIVKPPLMVWLVAISSILLNKGKVNEFTARFPSAIAACFTVFLLYFFIYKKLKNIELAFLSAFVLSTSYLFFKQARFAITDMVLLFFITSSIFSFFIGFEEDRKSFLILGFICMGLGFMDKGPVAFIIPTFVLLIYLYSRGQLIESLRKKEIIWGFLIFLAISLWWPLYVGKPYWEKFIVSSNVKRFAYNPSWKTSMFFYLYNFPAHFFVWSAFIPTIFHIMKRKRPENLSLFFIWFAFVFVFFSISDTKRSSYILPLYPAASVITGWAFNELKNMETKVIETLAPRTSKLLLFSGIIASGLLGFGKIIIKDFKIIHLILIFVTSTIYILGLFRLRKSLFKLFLSAALGFSLIYTNIYQPLADKAFHSPKYCSNLIKDIVKDSPLFVYGSIRANELFYLKKAKISKIKTLDELPKGSYIYTRKPSKFEKKFPHLKRVLCCSYQKEKLCLYKSD